MIRIPYGDSSKFGRKLNPEYLDFNVNTSVRQVIKII